MNGVINLLKPPGMTSHDAVAVIRKMLKIKKVGHTGTLDPGAAGVLPICLGKATKLSQYLTEKDKRYRAEMVLGKTSSTGDAFGTIKITGDGSAIDKDKIINILNLFQGDIEQIPPMVSAVKHKGKRLYQLEREGIEVTRKVRNVKIYNIDLLDVFDATTRHPKIIVDVKCSKGTYIRTLCSDIGEKLKTGAFLTFLLRTESGKFKISETVTFEEIKNYLDQNLLEKFLIPTDKVLGDFKSITVKESAEKSVINGNKLYLSGIIDGQINNGTFSLGELVKIYSSENRFLALAKVQSTYDQIEEEKKLFLQPITVFV